MHCYPSESPLYSLKAHLVQLWWTVRTASLKAILVKYGAVIDALYELSDEPGPTGAKAAGFCTKLQTFECLLAVTICYKVFVFTEQLSAALQNKTLTLTGSLQTATEVMSTLKHMRSDERFNEVWLKVCQRAK